MHPYSSGILACSFCSLFFLVVSLSGFGIRAIPELSWGLGIGWTPWCVGLLAGLCGQMGSLDGLCNHFSLSEVVGCVATVWSLWLGRAAP